MNTLFSHSRMGSLLQSLHTLSTVRVGYFDVSGAGVIAYPPQCARFCQLVRAAKNGDDACIACDSAAYEHVRRHRATHIYRCHAGLTEVISPITTDDDQLLGYLMIGQLRLVPHDAPGLKDAPPELRDAYHQLPAMSMEQLHATVQILQTFATYIWLDNCIRIQNEPLGARVASYVRAHLGEDLAIETLCRAFGVSKTTLCASVKGDLGTTVSALIRAERIKAAQHLLESSSLPIAHLAERVGIHDYNYFTKVFKEYTGVAPTIYRKLCENQCR